MFYVTHASLVILLCSGCKRKVKLIGVHHGEQLGMLHEELCSSTGCTTGTAVLGGAEEILSPENFSQTLLL